MRRNAILVAMALAPLPGTLAAQRPAPVIDMHLHAGHADFAGPPPLGLCVPLTSHMPPLDPRESWPDVFLRSFKEPSCPAPIWSPLTDSSLIAETVAVLERRNVIGVLAGPVEDVRAWLPAAPERFIPAADPDADGTLNPTSVPAALEPLFRSGEFQVMAEVSFQYGGIAPDDERLEPYWALAEKLDIPVGIHMGEGPPGATGLPPTYRARLTSPTFSSRSWPAIRSSGCTSCTSRHPWWTRWSPCLAPIQASTWTSAG